MKLFVILSHTLIFSWVYVFLCLNLKDVDKYIEGGFQIKDERYWGEWLLLIKYRILECFNLNWAAWLFLLSLFIMVWFMTVFSNTFDDINSLSQFHSCIKGIYFLGNTFSDCYSDSFQQILLSILKTAGLQLWSEAAYFYLSGYKGKLFT